MKRKVKSASELPEWFKTRSYKKQLSAVEWYVEVRARQVIAKILARKPDGPIEEHTRAIIRRLQSGAPAYSTGYSLREVTKAVNDLTVGEALYFRSVATDSEVIGIGRSLDSLLAVWHSTLAQMRAEGKIPEDFWQTVNQLQDKLDELSLTEQWKSPATQLDDNFGDPAAFSRDVFNGFPVTVDTYLDDETIIEHFKEWLSKQRQRAAERARRPFTRNDFDDWEHYKIRELFDLETWARLEGVKIQDKVLARAMWPTPPDDISPVDVLRTTTRKKARDVFTLAVAERLYRQLCVEKGENFLMEDLFGV